MIGKHLFVIRIFTYDTQFMQRLVIKKEMCIVIDIL